MSFQILRVSALSCSIKNEALNLAGSRCFAVDVERFETHRLTKLKMIRQQGSISTLKSGSKQSSTSRKDAACLHG